MLLAPRSMLLPLLLALCSLFLAPVARGQAALNGTEYGKSQNTAQDLVNSLTPGKERFGKGEKKSEVDPKTLRSKTIKDKTFEGGLNDIDVDWNGDKIGKPPSSQGANSTAGGREASANRSREAGNASPARTSVSGEPSTNADSKTSKPADAAAEKDSKASSQTSAAGQSEKAKSDQNKEQKATAAAAEQKPSEKEKTSASKTDGDH